MMDKTYTHSPFQGQIHCAAPATPFNPKGELMLDAYAEVLRYYLDVVRVDTLLIAGDNGEGYALSDDELRQVTETAAKTIADRIPFYVNVTRTSNRRCIERAEIAATAGAPGISLCQPPIHDASADKIVERFQAVAQAAPLRMMVYNLPLISHFNITADVLRSICDVAPVDVVKDAPPDMDHITTMLAEMGDRFPFLYGQRLTMIPALLLGSGGFVGTGPELFGAGARRVFDVHTMTPDERMEIHTRWGNVILAASFAGTSPAGIKAALNMLGLPAGVPRAPVRILGPEAGAKLAADLVENGVLEGPVAKRA